MDVCVRRKTQQELAAVGPKQKTNTCQNRELSKFDSSDLWILKKNSFHCHFRAVQDIDLKHAGVTSEDKSYLVFKFEANLTILSNQI